MHASAHRLRSRPSGAGRTIGSILLDAGRLSVDETERILRLQKDEGLRFGAAAVRLGILTDEDVRQALSHQFDYPYLSREDGSLHPELIAAYEPFSPSVENLRALRSQLMLRWFDGDTARKALAITSVDAQDGRSYLAANLAIVFSQLGEKTLLIDADLRTPRQHELFKLQDGPGLSTVLAERSGLDAISSIPALIGLSVLQAGPIPPNPQELLGRPTFTSLLASVALEYDVIIIDTPAAAPFADAQTVAVRAGAALLVARKDKSSLPGLNQLHHNLHQFGATVVGSVLNEA
ncbi:chain length determinant protein tyrosine kinase EpsG [Xylophilus sp. Kf1]|nr:chain length determinant protein tyrosine kinase EpsG [Xylophilus sp. Kf1]